MKRFLVHGDARYEPASEYEDDEASLEGDWVRAVDALALEAKVAELEGRLERVKEALTIKGDPPGSAASIAFNMILEAREVLTEGTNLEKGGGDE